MTMASQSYLLSRHALVRVLAAVVVAGAACAAEALPLTPFRNEAQAQRYCRDDIVVWLDFRKETYYSKRQRRYGRGDTGSYVCRNEARASGYRRSVLGIR